MMWFNQIHSHNASYFKCSPDWTNLNLSDDLLPFHTTYGDGSEVEDEVLQEIRNASWEVSVGWQMERGDLLLLDNMVVQHARLSFTHERKLCASLVAMDEEYYKTDHDQ